MTTTQFATDENNVATMDAVDLPAIAGGERAKTTPYGSEKRYGDEELEQLREALEQGTLFYASGQKTKALEAEFAARNGVGYGVACSSGTAAVHAALIAAGVSPGDEVITAPITDMGTVSPILYQGAIPVFADLEPRSYALSPQSVEAAITERTRAVIAVQLWGNSCDLNALKGLCDKHDLVLIEDCAQAFGCTYEGKPVGTIGHMGCFSFNEFKHISCGDGGLVLTNDEELARRARLGTDKCYNRRPDALVRDPMFLAPNYRITELQSAVALAQLGKLDSIVERRRAWCGRLNEALSEIEGLQTPQPTPGSDPSWWFYMLRVTPELGASSHEFAAALRAEGLPTGAGYIGKPVYEYPLFQQHHIFENGPHPCDERTYGHGDCPEAEAILQTCVNLAVNQAYTEQDLTETIHAFERVAAWFRDGGNQRNNHDQHAA